jgi:amino-acid N-acetyltransferase
MEFKLFKPLPIDISQMQTIVLDDVENGNILVRDESEMATTIRSYTAIKNQDNIIVGFVALHIHTPLLAEIRSLVIHKDFRGKGLGKRLIQSTIQEAQKLQLKEILVLTYAQSLFQQFNFNIIDKESIPNPKIWVDCIKCKHFPKCDEIALMLQL